MGQAKHCSLHRTGIVKGKNGQLLAPKDQITRAEVTVIIQKLLQKSHLI